MIGEVIEVECDLIDGEDELEDCVCWCEWGNGEWWVEDEMGNILFIGWFGGRCRLFIVVCWG